MSSNVKNGADSGVGKTGAGGRPSVIQKGQVRPVTTTIRSRNAIPVSKSSLNKTAASEGNGDKTKMTNATGGSRKVAPNVTKDPDKSPVKSKPTGKKNEGIFVYFVVLTERVR